MRRLPLEGRDFGYTHCVCEHCSLRAERDKSFCPAFLPPNDFNGLMVIGEGPGANEARYKVPFVGRAGQLLDELLKKAGLAREQTWITNATSCQPPPAPKQTGKGAPKGFTDLHPWAVPACLPRLNKEIAFAQPRVIMVLGQAALASLTGAWRSKKTRVPRASCALCLDERTLPVWTCAGCKTTHFLPSGHSGWCGLEMASTCPSCGQAGTVKVAARKKMCPACGGKKTDTATVWKWATPHSVTATAGTVFRGPLAPDRLLVPEEARLDLPCRYVIPTYHPSFLLRNPDKKTKKAPGGQFLVNASIAHFEKAARLLVEDAYWPFTYGVVRPADASEPEVSFEEMRAFLTSGATIETDIETDSKEAWSVTEITCIGFASYEHKRAITFNTQGIERSDPRWLWLISWLKDARYRKVLQNGIYDTQVLWHVWQVEVEGYYGDTLLAHNAVHPDEPHNLQHLAGVYTDSPLWKPVKSKGDKELFESPQQRHIYNARDAFNTAFIWHREERQMEAEQARFVHDLDLGMIGCAREMERVGLPLSKPKWDEWRARAEHYRDVSLEGMRSFLGAATFNPDSLAHLQYALYDPHGPMRLVPAKYTDPSPTHPRGQPSTAKTALLAHKTHPFVSNLLDFRRWARVLSVYFDGMAVSSDYRLRVSWNPIGARTGRWTSSPNVQNWFKTILIQIRAGNVFPADQHKLVDLVESWSRIPGIRECVVAPPGRKIVGADLSQAELRVLGALSGDEALIALLIAGDRRMAELKAQGIPKAERDLVKYDPQYDVHSYVASLAFGAAYLQADVHTAHGLEVRSRLRDLIKRVIYGLNYGAGVDTILEAIYDGEYEGPPITSDQIEIVIAAYFRAFPRIKVWREQIRQKAEKTGRVTDALIGRRREFPLLQVDTTVAYNFAIQCLRQGTPVLTNRGYVPVETFTQGRAWDGTEWAPAVGLSKAPEQVWRVELSTGQHLDVNAGHFLAVADEGAWAWRATAELRVGDRVAQPRVEAQRYGASLDEGLALEDAFWLGYFIGNGSIDATRRTLQFCFGSRVGRSTHEAYAQRFVTWARQHGTVWRPNGSRKNMTVSGVASSTNDRVAAFLRWGVQPEWRAHTKRVPRAVWATPLEQRQQFILGYLEADGTLATAQPSVNTPNRALLEDMQLLARTCGLASVIRGPYVADRAGHIAWRWTLNGSLLRHVLGYGAVPARQRFTHVEKTLELNRQRFIEAFPKNPFSNTTQHSFYVLWSRLRHGGFTNPQTLARMWEAAQGSIGDDWLYGSAKVVSVTPLEEEAPMFTLSVLNERHRYDSAGVISKNSSVGSLMNLVMFELYRMLREADPSAFLLAQVHDAIYVECDEDRANDVAKLLELTMNKRLRLVDDAPFMDFPAVAKIADNWFQAG